jgi:hypothetical protein
MKPNCGIKETMISSIDTLETDFKNGVINTYNTWTTNTVWN